MSREDSLVGRGAHFASEDILPPVALSFSLLYIHVPEPTGERRAAVHAGAAAFVLIMPVCALHAYLHVEKTRTHTRGQEAAPLTTAAFEAVLVCANVCRCARLALRGVLLGTRALDPRSLGAWLCH